MSESEEATFQGPAGLVGGEIVAGMVVSVADSLDHILSEEDHTHAANGRQIYSLFDDEQDWAGLLTGLEPVRRPCIRHDASSTLTL